MATVQSFEQREESFFVDHLGGTGEVLVPLFKRLVRSTRGAEKLTELVSVKSAYFR